MNNIIIYGSHYGTTKQYAEELSKRTNIKAISFKKFNQQINDYDNIIYLGALYAGGVLGMSKTLKKLNNISNKKILIATVGLSDPTDEVNKNNIRNNIKNQIPKEVFEKAKKMPHSNRMEIKNLIDFLIMGSPTTTRSAK